MNNVIEELKQRLSAKTAKIRRYEQRIEQYKQNRMFRYDQKRVYQSFSGDNHREEVKPDAQLCTAFWRDIWGNEKYHNKSAEWLKDLRAEKDSVQQENVVITKSLVKAQCRKIPNWKAPGPDGVQGYWIKTLTALHDRIASQMNDMINNGVAVPNWMTYGKTYLCQKDQSKGNAVDNYRPISCLPVMWKLLTGVLAGQMYAFLDEHNILPQEQKGCRKKSSGTKDQILIDKMILQDCKQKHKNLAMAWVDYRKAYDLVPHSWILECLELAGISENIKNFIDNTMKKWTTELTSCGEFLGKFSINRGIFQGDSLSPLLFVVCMIPLTKILRKIKAGYVIKDGNLKVNHLLFMDDLKLFGSSEREIDSLVKTVQGVSTDIGMEFGIKKCGVVIMKRGKLSSTDGIVLPNGETIKEVEKDGYRYLGILELDKLKEKEMKDKLKREYLRRTRLILKSKLNGRNIIRAINTWAIPVLRYGAGLLKWTKEELECLDRRTRKLLTMYKVLHPKSDVARLYVPRHKGGRELISCDTCIKSEENRLGWYVKQSNELMLKVVSTKGVIKTEEAVRPEDFKQMLINEREHAWKEKRMHGQYAREVDESVDKDKTWGWLKNGGLKGCTESLICAAQDQALRTNYVKHHIDNTAESPLCRLCGEKGETVSHIVSECKMLAQREYKRRHDTIARKVHWALCGEFGLGRTSKWYEHKPEGVIRKGSIKVLWDFTIQCDHEIEARRPGIVLVNEELKECKIIDVAVPWDSRIRSKEREKIEKYGDLKREVAAMWGMKKVIVIPIVVGALGAVSKELDKYIEKIGITLNIGHVQNTAILGTARILRKVLET